jgi:hypothetical protein
MESKLDHLKVFVGVSLFLLVISPLLLILLVVRLCLEIYFLTVFHFTYRAAESDVSLSKKFRTAYFRAFSILRGTLEDYSSFSPFILWHEANQERYARDNTARKIVDFCGLHELSFREFLSEENQFLFTITENGLS